MLEKKLFIRGIDPLLIYGMQDAYLNLIEQTCDVQIIARGNELIVRGDAEKISHVEKAISELMAIANRNGAISEADVEMVTRLAKWQEGPSSEKTDLSSIILYTKNYPIKPRTKGQEKYYTATQKNDIVFVIGPAGTGKTYMAVALALAKLRDKEVDRIVLCRPAVEAGESLGFLPGDLREKIDPYLRPLYDALYEMVPLDKLKKQLESHIIEIAPLAYMRGRTLNNCFVILDEAQNTTPGQMKMFLTRLGANSRAIITGDVTQIDLPNRSESGLIHVQQILQAIDGISFVYLTDKDVVRHPLVRKIILAYEKYDQLSQPEGNGS